MNARVVVILALSLAAAAAIPGPCAYDPHPELDCVDDGVCPEGLVCSFDGFCKDPSQIPGACPDGGCPEGFQCDGAGGCFDESNGCPEQGCPPGFACDGVGGCFDPGGSCGECPAGFSCNGFECEPNRDCPYANAGAIPRCSINEVCVPLSLDLDTTGACVPAPTTLLPTGSACVPTVGENPCERGWCAPTGPGAGVCLAHCIQDPQDFSVSCEDPSETCTSPYAGGSLAFMQACVPACDDDTACPTGLNACLPGSENCLPENQRCAIVGCADERCAGECVSDGDCEAGDTCGVLEVFSSCDAFLELDVCQGPADFNQSCDFIDGVVCADGLSCVASRDRGICVTQSNEPIADGAACVDVQNANVCEAGAYCARTGDDIFAEEQVGVCLRFCDGDDDCAGDLCRQAAVLASNSVQPHSLCVPACDLVNACPETLLCDIETSSGCDGSGHCAAVLNLSFVPACVANDECNASAVCLDSACQPFDTACP